MKSNSTSLYVYFSLSFVALFGLVEFGLRGYLVLFWIYIVLSVVTFVTYGKDKYAAVKGSWRTPEIWLHSLSFLGGWPGALIARSWLRHKTQKQPFTAILWVFVLLNVVLFLSSFTPQGGQVIESVLAFSSMNKL